MAPSDGHRNRAVIRLALILPYLIHGSLSAQIANPKYIMDRQSDCSSVGVLDMERGKTTFVTPHSATKQSSPQLSCTLQFAPQTRGDTLKMWFESGASVDDCGVSLNVQMTDNSAFQLGCQTVKQPPKMEARDGKLHLRLTRKIYNDNYNFKIGIRAERSVAKEGGGGSGSDDLDVGVIVGIVIGVIAIIIILCIVCVCCCTKSRRADKVDGNSAPPIQTYENKMLQNGVSKQSSTSSGRKLLERNENDDSLRGRSALDRFGRVEPHSAKKSSDNYSDVDVESNRPGRIRERQGRPQEEETGRKSPLLSDLHHNKKFRRSFHDNEVDAQDRKNRISYASENSSESFNSRGVSLPPKLPPVPRSPPRSPSPHRRGETIAMISRDRPLSSSSDMARQLDENGFSDDASDGDRKKSTRHKLKPDRSGRKSRRSEEDDSEEERSRRKKERDRRERERQEEEEEEKKRRKKEDRRRREEEEDERDRKRNKRGKNQDDDTREYEGRFKKSASGRRSKGKSPRKGRSRSTGHALDEMEDNYQRSRSKSPSSVRSLNFIEDDEDDLDSTYQPFKRSASKTSLYASRSSLYGRRRKNSMGDTISLSSYAIDDADSRFGDFDKNGLSRKEKHRLFKSTGELEMHTATAQVVRECTTQTGAEKAVQVYGRKTIAKSRPGRMYSRGSQTGVSGRQRRDSTGSARSGKSGRSSRLKHKSKSQESLRKERRSKSRNRDYSDDSDDRRSHKSRSKSKDFDSTDDEVYSQKGKPRKHHRSKSRGIDDEDDDRQSSKGARSRPKPRPRKSHGTGSVDLSDSDLGSEGGKSAAASSIAASMAHPPHQQPNAYGGHFIPVAYPGAPMTFLPTAPGGPPMAPYMTAPAGRKPPVAPKPQKSKWDTLVEITEGEKQRNRQAPDTFTETESMLSSVYSRPGANSAHVGQVYAPPSYTTAQRYPNPNVTISSSYPNSSDLPHSARGARNYKLDSVYTPSESMI